MAGQILYCGDTSLTNAAAYLAGLMTAWGWQFDYVASDRSVGESEVTENLALVILSDYSAARISSEIQHLIEERVTAGAGLVMFGGWESFQGCGGNWRGTILGDLLPVEISATDDRVNCDRAVYVRPRDLEHPITAGLPWMERPPLIGGFNRVVPKSGSSVVLDAVEVHAHGANGGFEFSIGDTFPLLVTGQHGAGRTAAFMSDVAPHWIGPMVDWGSSRVQARASQAEPIEVGRHYADFFRQLLEFVKQPD